MYDDDGGIGVIIGFCMVLALIAAVIYIAVLVAAAVGMLAGAAGTIWGGGTALKNYFASFKENIIDSNRKSVAAMV